MSASGLLFFVQIPLLGLDSFVAGLLIGPVLKPWRDRSALAVMFGMCDGGGTFAGALLPHAVPDFSDVVVYALVVAAVLLAARRSSWWLAATPVVMALDNLAAGAPASAAPISAISSGLMALAGMALSGFAWSVGRRLFRRLMLLLVHRARPQS